MSVPPEIVVETVPQYVPRESDPAARRYVFAYTITISNRGSAGARLVNRHWLITDGDGDQDEVHGPGVVGEQPYLEPGAAFRYTSAAVLETPFGTMEGEYEFDTDAGERFRVPIPRFTLSMPGTVH